MEHRKNVIAYKAKTDDNIEVTSKYTDVDILNLFERIESKDEHSILNEIDEFFDKDYKNSKLHNLFLKFYDDFFAPFQGSATNNSL